MCSECVQSVLGVQSVFRVCSECVQSVLNIEVISSSSASSVSIFDLSHMFSNVKLNFNMVLFSLIF